MTDRQTPLSPREDTDQTRFLDLMTSFGLEPHVEPVAEETTVVSLRADEGGVGGYNFFRADFEFTKEGKFQHVSIWE